MTNTAADWTVTRGGSSFPPLLLKQFSFSSSFFFLWFFCPKVDILLLILWQFSSGRQPSAFAKKNEKMQENTRYGTGHVTKVSKSYVIISHHGAFFSSSSSFFLPKNVTIDR